MSPSHTPRQGTWGYKWNFNFRTLDSHSHIHHCRQLHVICICHNNTDPITETCFLHVCVPVLRVRRPYLPSHTFAPEYCFRRLVCILFVFLCFFLFYFCASPVIFHCLACTARRVRTHTSGSHIPDDEIRHAEDKFAESLQLAQIGMFNLLDNDVSELCTWTLLRGESEVENSLKSYSTAATTTFTMRATSIFSSIYLSI